MGTLNWLYESPGWGLRGWVRQGQGGWEVSLQAPSSHSLPWSRVAVLGKGPVSPITVARALLPLNGSPQGHRLHFPCRAENFQQAEFLSAPSDWQIPQHKGLSALREPLGVGITSAIRTRGIPGAGYVPFHQVGTSPSQTEGFLKAKATSLPQLGSSVMGGIMSPLSKWMVPKAESVPPPSDWEAPDARSPVYPQSDWRSPQGGVSVLPCWAPPAEPLPPPPDRHFARSGKR